MQEKNLTKWCGNRRTKSEDAGKGSGLGNGTWDGHNNDSEYKLCKRCSNRLQNFALRPLEYFNLAAIHGNSFHLHDDFYDYEIEEAYQPEIEVIDPSKFKFPQFHEIKNNLTKLVDFSIVQFFKIFFAIYLRL